MVLVNVQEASGKPLTVRSDPKKKTLPFSAKYCVPLRVTQNVTKNIENNAKPLVIRNE